MRIQRVSRDSSFINRISEADELNFRLPPLVLTSYVAVVLKTEQHDSSRHSLLMSLVSALLFGQEQKEGNEKNSSSIRELPSSCSPRQQQPMFTRFASNTERAGRFI